MRTIFESQTQEFLNKNKITIEIIKKIDNYLLGQGLISSIPIINCCTLALKESDDTNMQNSNLLIDSAGYGKTTLLTKIIAPSNKKIFQILPTKIYAYKLAEKGNDYFNNKILIHDDLIEAFDGLSDKSLKQLVAFFTSLLSEKRWGQLNVDIKIDKCIAMFGMAQSSYLKHKSTLFESTFFERIVPITQRLRKKEEKMKILQHKNKLRENNMKLPQIKLPLSNLNKIIKINLSPVQHQIINETSLEFEAYNILSATRSQNYIYRFIKANALLNERNEVCQEDIDLFEILKIFHIGNQSKVNYLLEIIKNNPNSSNTELMNLSKMSEKTFKKYKRMLKDLGKI